MAKLKALIEERGMKQSWLAKKIGVAEPTLSRWITGHVPVPDEYVQPLADIFHVGPEEVRNGHPKPRGRPPKNRQDEVYGEASKTRKLVAVPTLMPVIPSAADTEDVPFYRELRPAAGKGGILDRETMPVEDWIPVPKTALKPRGNWFVFEVEGTSMAGLKLREGDLVVCREEIEPPSGKVVIATHDGRFLIKLFEKRIGSPSVLVSVPGDGDTATYNDIEIVAGQTWIHAVVAWRMESVDQLVKRARRKKFKTKK